MLNPIMLYNLVIIRLIYVTSLPCLVYKCLVLNTQDVVKYTTIFPKYCQVNPSEYNLCCHIKRVTGGIAQSYRSEDCTIVDDGKEKV